MQLQGAIVVSGSFDNTVRMWDTRSGKCVGSFAGHTAPLMCLQFEESMHTVVTGSRDTTIKVWDTRSFKCATTFSEHTDWVRRLRFDQQKIISGSYDCTLKVSKI
jgi:WD40 repeat protein